MGHFGPLTRIRHCIRLDEVLILQGAPALGVVLAGSSLSLHSMATLVAVVLANTLLVAHVFVLNDWAGEQSDRNDINRATTTYAIKGISSEFMTRLAWLLLALSMLVFAWLGLVTLLLALAIAVLSAIYSSPAIQGKGIPVLSSVLHLVGGTLHFLLGYSAMSPISWQSILMGSYFGLVFAAGHLSHETRDHDADSMNGIHTNAVYFGKRRAFLASQLLFGAAYLLLSVMALKGYIHWFFSLTPFLYAMHLAAGWRAYRDGLSYSAVRRLQGHYRNAHAMIGVGLLATGSILWLN